MGSFTPPLHHAPSLLWVEGVFPGGFFSVHVPSLIFLSRLSHFPLRSIESLGLQSNLWDACSKSLLIWRGNRGHHVYNLQMGFLLWQVCNGSCFLFCYKILIRVHFSPTRMGEIGSTLEEPPKPVQGYILWDTAKFPRGSVRDMPPTCLSPLHHRWRQATHNTLVLGSCPTVSYLFRDRPIAWQVHGYPPHSDVPGSHSNLGILVVTASWLSSVCGFCLFGVRSWKSHVWLFLWMKELLYLQERCCLGRSGPIPLPWMSCDFTPLDNVVRDYVTEHIYIRPFGILLMERHWNWTCFEMCSLLRLYAA